jgi:hypothetical protein
MFSFVAASLDREEISSGAWAGKSQTLLETSLLPNPARSAPHDHRFTKTDGLLAANVATEGAKDGGQRSTTTPGLVVTSGQRQPPRSVWRS